MRDYAEILPTYEQRWAERPDSYYFIPLANAYRAVGQPQRAIEVLKQGLEHHPDSLSGRVALAAAYLDAGLHTGAEEEAHQILAAQPENLLIGRLLVACHREAGQLEKALTETKRLLELAPHDDRLQETLQELEGPLAEKAEEVATAETPPGEAAPSPLPESPTDLEPTETLAELYVNQGLLHEAIDVYTQLLTHEPANEQVRERLEALKREREALETLIDDTAAMEEIHSLFPSQSPPEEDRTAHVIATLEGWLDALGRRRGTPPASR